MRRLLIADDERTIREGIASSIDWASLGIDRVLLAADGREAYELIKKEKPEIAIVDIIMPEMTGIEVISRLKEEGEKTEFIIISGYGEFSYAREAIRYHVNNYILKPCDVEEIITTVKKISENLTHQQSLEQERRRLREYISLIEPQAQEQLLREFITENCHNNPGLIQQIFANFKEELQLLLFYLKEIEDYSKLLLLKRYIDNKFAINDWYFSIILHDCLILIFRSEDRPKVDAFARQFCQEMTKYSFYDLKVAISERGTWENLPKIYKKTRETVKMCSPWCDNTDNILIDATIAQGYSRIVRQVIQYVNENLSDNSLSLNYIASKILYLNPDYLGKLFKKECGMKFSDYLMRLRMEKAKQILAAAGELKMYEVAQRVGFGDNVAYFGQVFRKYTGLLPSEYRAKHGH